MSTLNAPHPGHYGPPQGRSNNGIVITLVVAIVLAAAGFGGWWFFNNQSAEQVQPLPVEQSQAPQQPAPAQSETQDQQVSTQAPSMEQSPAQGESEQTRPRQEQSQERQQPQEREQQTSQPNQGGAPPLPEEFGDFKANYTSSEGGTASYKGPNYEILVVMHLNSFDMEDMRRSHGNGREIGGWYCREPQGTGGSELLRCAHEAHGGVVRISLSAAGSRLDDLAAIGDDLLAAWK